MQSYESSKSYPDELDPTTTIEIKGTLSVPSRQYFGKEYFYATEISSWDTAESALSGASSFSGIAEIEGNVSLSVIESNSSCPPPILELPENIKPWEAQPADLDNLSQAMKGYYGCFKARMEDEMRRLGLGGQLNATSAFRPLHYQAHLWEVWNKFHRTSNVCSYYASIAHEYNTHGFAHRPFSAQNPRAAKHTTGEAFDIPQRIARHELLRDRIDQIAAACNLRRPYRDVDPPDLVHFEPISSSANVNSLAVANPARSKNILHFEQYDRSQIIPVRVYVSQQTSNDKVIYSYHLANNSNQSIVAVDIGYDDSQQKSSLILPPIGWQFGGISSPPATSVTSPNGWSARVIPNEESDLLDIEWRVNNLASVLPVGQTLTNFSIALPSEDINYKTSKCTIFFLDSSVATVALEPYIRPMANVSAASFNIGAALSPEAIVSAFGKDFAVSTRSANTFPLPVNLAGTTVKVIDTARIERLAPLFFVSPTQINYQVPQGTMLGTATVTVTSGDGEMSAAAIPIAPVMPGLFTVNASGQGLAAGVLFRVKAGGAQSFEPIGRYDATQNRFVPIPIDLGPANEQVFLLLFGTGFRYRSSLSAVALNFGGFDAMVTYAGPQGDLVGVDQINVLIPRELVGRGNVFINLLIDGVAANSVLVNIK